MWVFYMYMYKYLQQKATTMLKMKYLEAFLLRIKTGMPSVTTIFNIFCK